MPEPIALDPDTGDVNDWLIQRVLSDFLDGLRVVVVHDEPQSVILRVMEAIGLRDVDAALSCRVTYSIKRARVRSVSSGGRLHVLHDERNLHGMSADRVYLSLRWVGSLDQWLSELLSHATRHSEDGLVLYYA